jgi:hypothetical protein
MSLIQSNRIKTIRKALADGLEALTGKAVYMALDNKAPFPEGSFILLNVIGQARQATNRVENHVATAIFYRDETVLSELSVQVDCYGADSQDVCNAVEMLSRSTQLIGYGILPIYAGAPRQLPFEDAHNLMLEKWSIDLTIQYNNTFTSVADKIDTAIIPITTL